MADRSRESVQAVVDAIWAVLHKHPDHRVGQIIANASEGDPYYVENRTLASMIAVAYPDIRALSREGGGTP